MTKVVTLVPYRESDPARMRAWEITRPYLDALGYPVFLGDSLHSDFNRSAAINAASRNAGTWDVAVIADADTVQSARPVHTAVGLAQEVSVVPWRTRYKLSQEGTEKLALEGPEEVGIGDLDRTDGFAHPRRLLGYPPSRMGSTIVVSRAAWDLAEGFDERFQSWGWEDQAFRMSIGPLEAIPGRIWHLFHPHAPRDDGTRRNRDLFRREYLHRR